MGSQLEDKKLDYGSLALLREQEVMSVTYTIPHAPDMGQILSFWCGNKLTDNVYKYINVVFQCVLGNGVKIFQQNEKNLYFVNEMCQRLLSRLCQMNIFCCAFQWDFHMHYEFCLTTHWQSGWQGHSLETRQLQNAFRDDRWLNDHFPHC